MSEMVDRVALAIESQMGGKSVDMARAAIEAMREPTAAMLDELDINNCGWGLREHSKTLWQSLIDEVLK